MVKNSWKLHTHWNPRQLGRRWGWGPGRGTEALQRPLEHHQKTWWIAHHILARIHMKLGTHIDLIKPNNFCAACQGSAQQEVGYSGLFKNHMLWNLKILLPGFSTQEHQTLWTCSQDIGDAKLRRDFWYLKRFARGEAMKLWRELRDRKCLIKSTYIVWFWSQFSGLFGVWSRSHRCDNYEAKL